MRIHVRVERVFLVCKSPAPMRGKLKKCDEIVAGLRFISARIRVCRTCISIFKRAARVNGRLKNCDEFAAGFHLITARVCACRKCILCKSVCACMCETCEI